jgi:hypothetical protein
MTAADARAQRLGEQVEDPIDLQALRRLEIDLERPAQPFARLLLDRFLLLPAAPRSTPRSSTWTRSSGRASVRGLRGLRPGCARLHAGRWLVLKNFVQKRGLDGLERSLARINPFRHG